MTISVSCLFLNAIVHDILHRIWVCLLRFSVGHPIQMPFFWYWREGLSLVLGNECQFFLLLHDNTALAFTALHFKINYCV